LPTPQFVAESSIRVFFLESLPPPIDLEQEGFGIQSEDIVRLSPLVFEHINVLRR
jgi:hypothetical protein